MAVVSDLAPHLETPSANKRATTARVGALIVLSLLAGILGGFGDGSVIGLVSRQSGTVDLARWPTGSVGVVTATRGSLGIGPRVSQGILDEKGAFELVLPPGRYELQAEVTGSDNQVEHASPEIVKILPFQTVEVELVIRFP